MEGIEPGSRFVLCTWEAVPLRGAKAAWSLPASWVCITCVSMGKLLNLNTRHVSPCGPQDLSSTPLIYHVALMVNAVKQSAASVCRRPCLSPLLVVLFFPAGMLAGPELACWPVCSTSKYGSIPLSSLLGHCFLDFPTSMFWDFKTRLMSPIPSPTSCIPRGSQ